MALHFPLHLAPSMAVFWLSLGWAGRKEVAGCRFEEGAGSRIADRRVIGWTAAALVACVLILRGVTCNVLLGEGYRFFRGGAPRLAEPFFERFERLSARNYEERFYAGAMYQALGDEARAIDAYQRAVDLYPGMQGALYNLGNVYFHRQDYAQAAARYARVLAINPEEENALNNLGNCLGLLGRPAEAEQYYLKVIALNPVHADALYNLAVNAYRLKRYRDARKWLARTLAAHPAYPPAGDLRELLRDAPR